MLTKTSVVRLRADQRGEAVVDLGPHLVGGDGAQLVVGNLDGEIHGAAVADVDDARADRSGIAATSSMGLTVADSPMRCGFGPATSASSRASDSARCEPRLSSATA